MEVVNGFSAGLAVTAMAGMYQCAETITTARGLGTLRPICAHASLYLFLVIAFIGFPCPKNTAGMRCAMRIYIRYSIQYTITPVTLTYIQMGRVQRAIAR